MISRRFPIKTMFMGVVARPIPHRRFGGKVLMERVSTTKRVQKATSHRNFSDDALVNEAIINGEWKNLICSTEELVVDILDFISTSYALEEFISQRMEASFVSKIGNAGRVETKVLLPTDVISHVTIRDQDDKNVPPRPLQITDINIRVRNRINDVVEEDCTCDSEYMKKAMDRVGLAIREAYNWMKPSETCYLVMDNAGGHGSKEAIVWYKQLLLTKYNVELIFQVPRSPYTNVLDLGVWMAIQSIVERNHFLKRCTTDALVRTVMHTWESTDLDRILSNVFNRLRVVLCNILKGNGNNDCVEENRGVSGRMVKIENAIKKLATRETDDEVVDVQNFQAAVREDGDDNDIFQEI